MARALGHARMQATTRPDKASAARAKENLESFVVKTGLAGHLGEPTLLLPVIEDRLKRLHVIDLDAWALYGVYYRQRFTARLALIPAR